MKFSITKKNKVFQKNCMKVGVNRLLRAGMVPARTWRVHAVGVAPTERFKLRRQMAAAAGKKCRTSLSLFMEAFGLEVEEGLSPPWPLSTGQKVFGLEDGAVNKKKLG